MEGFENIPEAASQQFFRDMSSSSQKLTCQQMDGLLERHERRETFFQEGGRFLPLKVWERKGFDPVAIAAHTLPEDITNHPVLGLTYRVRLLATGTRGAKGWQQTSRARASGLKRRAPEAIEAAASSAAAGEAAAGEAAAGEEAVEEKSASQSCSSSSSSSSSSSTRGKKKKHSKKSKKKTKKKKDKKDKSYYDKKAKAALARQKEKEKREREQKKADEKKEKDEQAKTKREEAAKKTLAEAIVLKLNPVMLAFGTVISSQTFGSLPQAIISSVTSLYDAATAHETSARQVALDPSLDLHDGITSLKPITKLIADLKKSQALVSQMITTIENMPGS